MIINSRKMLSRMPKNVAIRSRIHKIFKTVDMFAWYVSKDLTKIEQIEQVNLICS
jgi:hypothetical protein